VSQPTILVINDDKDITNIIADILEFHGEYHAVTAYNGAAGIALAVSERPALIIVDNMMPDPNGYEVCRTVHANPLTSAIPIIMTLLSGIPDFESLGRAAGADELLYFPFEPDELFQRVKAVLARGRSVEH